MKWVGFIVLIVSGIGIGQVSSIYFQSQIANMQQIIWFLQQLHTSIILSNETVSEFFNKMESQCHSNQRTEILAYLSQYLYAKQVGFTYNTDISIALPDEFCDIIGRFFQSFGTLSKPKQDTLCRETILLCQKALEDQKQTYITKSRLSASLIPLSVTAVSVLLL